MKFPQSAVRSPLGKRGFTLVELLAVIVIAAILATAAGVFIAGYVEYAQRLSDQQTLTVLNDALTRYKCEGGDVAGLTLGISPSRVLAKMAQTLSWAGVKHSVINRGATYPARSLTGYGAGSQYRFFRFDTYTDSGTTPAGWGSGTNVSGEGPTIVGIFGGTNQAIFSTDGINWSTTTLPQSNNWMGVAYGNGRWIGMSAWSYNWSCSTAQME